MIDAAEDQHSNLLIIISDEHRKDAMGCMGHPIVKTPNLDSLAARGTLFLNAYTPSPMCVPTRASIACGDYVHNIGYWDSATPYDGKRRSWMRHLRDQGVDVTSIGKLHFRSNQDDNGFTRELLPMHVVGGVGWAVGLLREDPPAYDAAAELAGDVGVGPSSYTDYDLDITQKAVDWLQDKDRRDTPWAAFVSLVSPHYPLTCPEHYFDLYDPAEVDLPVGYGTRRRPDHRELQNIARFFDYDRYFDEQKMRQAKAAYYGLTSFMDNCVGRILQALRDSGQQDNTTVLYVSDHGDMMGDQGFWTKQVMYEQSAGVPMIAAGPGFPAGRRVTTGTSLIDIAATAVDVSGVAGDAISAALPGVSLRDIAADRDDPDRTIFSEYHDGGSTTGTFMVRWQTWKYVHYVGHPPQLFDLSHDPNELRDLAPDRDKDPHIQAALQEGAARLRQICDPEAVNTQCFADQQRRIAELGGKDACLNAYAFNHTPTPSEQDDLRQGAPL
ncbi:sulfatase-like hydrolase/transferase [Phaeobacter sp.]|uniref:sulfatase-like hydrolase/transferase n=1 Tax=Phaeobacter sp. TaxID=1902409 RepID=UPI0025E23104|nr:sulfatase-like hydrolase/transferase [Phaeobacter sp.]